MRITNAKLIGMQTFALAATALLFVATGHPTIAADRPNLIWIMADDLGYGDLGCYGQKVITTPHLDQMAKEGIRFTQFYAGATVCAPSRSVLMTGQHHGRTRVRGNAGPNNPAAQALRPGDVTVASVLQDAGYRTALIGKWGLGDMGPAENIMHSTVKIGDSTIMMCDDPRLEAAPGDGNISLAVGVDDTGRAAQIFDALSQDGVVTMPLGKTYWAAAFGMVTDKFGIKWMVNCEAGK